MIPKPEDVFNSSLLALCQQLVDDGGLSSIEAFFKPLEYHVSSLSETVFGIKYKDGVNQLWRPRWAREARGAWFGVDDQGVVRYLSKKLQRGAEVLTLQHSKNNVTETQDTRQSAFTHLDDTQQEVIKKLNDEDGKFDGYLTNKVDGALICVNMFPWNSREQAIVEPLLDDFARVLVDASKARNLPVMPVISSSGTLVIGANMQTYFLSTMIDTDSVDPSTPVLTLWKERVDSFVGDLVLFVNDNCQEYGMDSSLTTLCFEGVCNNRTSYDGECHTELAVSYHFNALFFLGATCGGGDLQRYVPHCEFDVVTVPWRQPKWRRVGGTSDVVACMQSLERVIQGEADLVDADHIGSEDLSFDLEGFVLLVRREGEEHTTEFDYSKIKTPIYYALHKAKIQEYSGLLEMPDCLDRFFPTLRKLRLLNATGRDQLVDFIDELLPFLDAQLESAPRSGLVATFPEKARASFGKQTRKVVKYRMVANVNKEQFNAKGVKMFRARFDVQQDEVCSTLCRHVCAQLFRLLDKQEMADPAQLAGQIWSDELLYDLFFAIR